ncbi:MAG: hypothetical protein ACM31C_05400 [Acidobacteriota bacterium]
MRTICSLLLVAASAGTAAAQPAPEGATATSSQPATQWTAGVEPRFGVMLPTSKLRAMVVGGLEVDVALPPANHQLVLGIDLALTRPSYDATAMDPRLPGGSTSYTIHQTEVVAGLTAQYRFTPAGSPLVPFVGAGPILHMLKTNETDIAAPGENTATQTKLGLELVGGLDIQAGPGLVCGELRFLYSGLDTPLAGATNAGYIALAAGYRLVF